jgi:hypothetical protein
MAADLLSTVRSELDARLDEYGGDAGHTTERRVIWARIAAAINLR